MQRYPVSAKEMLNSLRRNRSVIVTLIKRDVSGRYRGSVMGILWSFFQPVLMLAVYTFVFSVVFRARWNENSDSKTEFALVLFAGLIVFGLFSECVNRAPSLILSNANYVKKVVFPLEILPIVALGSALFHMLVSIGVWLVFYLIFFGLPHLTVLLLPLILAPPVLLTIGFSWFLASLAVYLRDVNQIVGIFTTVLMFLSPIFYPLSSLPERYRPFLYLNPLSLAIEQTRDVLIWNTVPNSLMFGGYLTASVFVAWLGFSWFQITRKGFADVI